MTASPVTLEDDPKGLAKRIRAETRDGEELVERGIRGSFA
jgi:hypothetical protein